MVFKLKKNEPTTTYQINSPTELSYVSLNRSTKTNRLKYRWCVLFILSIPFDLRAHFISKTVKIVCRQFSCLSTISLVWLFLLCWSTSDVLLCFFSTILYRYIQSIFDTIYTYSTICGSWIVIVYDNPMKKNFDSTAFELEFKKRRKNFKKCPPFHISFELNDYILSNFYFFSIPNVS